MFGVYIRELLMKRMPKQWLFSEGRKSYHHYFLLVNKLSFHFSNPKGDSEVTKWPPFTLQDEAYLNIAATPKVEFRFQAAKMAFWNELIPKIASYDGKKRGKCGPYSQEKVKEEL